MLNLRLHQLAPWLGLALGLAAYLSLALPLRDSVVDDAWISARYARHWADGHGPTFNVGEPAVEGFTNPLWVILLALGHRLGGDPHAWMVDLGLIFGALLLVAALALSRALAGRSHAALAAVPIVIGLDPHLAVVASNGIETTQFASLVTLFLAGAIANPAGAGRWGVGVLAALLAWVRPEGALLALMGVGLHLRLQADAPRAALPWLLPLGGSLLVQAGWRWWWFQALWPNTIDAKALGDPWVTLWNNLVYLYPDGPYWLGVALIGLIGLPEERRAALFLALATALIVLPPLRVEMWMPGGRLLFPAVPLILAAAVARGTRTDDRGRLSLVIPLLGLALLWGSPLPQQVFAGDRAHTALPGNAAAQVASHLGAALPDGSWAAVRDAGVFAFHLGSRVKIAETHPRALTRRPGLQDAWIEDVPNNPALVVLTVAREDASNIRYQQDGQVFQRLNRPYKYLGRFYQHYHRYYDVYARADLTLPPVPESWITNRRGPPPPGRTDKR